MSKVQSALMIPADPLVIHGSRNGSVSDAKASWKGPEDCNYGGSDEAIKSLVPFIPMRCQ